ncbi:ATP/GTP-binding protein [Streptomyces sp. NPDC020362]|uniref:ATP/GTP-binding protein n=1 Tax=Streptomyces sp. NPDC020362 TaxID=3154486 RepID=UPI0034084511
MAETTLRSRLSAGWERAEGALTRIVLLAVFVVGLIAQFVKPVGDALQGKVYISAALLSLVGFALYSEVRRLNSAQERQREEQERNRETTRDLAAAVRALTEQQAAASAQIDSEHIPEELRRALCSGNDIKLATMAFTGENFSQPLKRLLGALSPDADRTVHLRVLLPDFTQPMGYPGRVRPDGTIYDAPAFRAFLMGRICEYKADLEGMAGRMSNRGQGTLTVAYRVLPLPPRQKVYLLNEDQVIEGTYDKFELRPDVYSTDGSTDLLLDIIGHEEPLSRWHRDAGPQAREKIRYCRSRYEHDWKRAVPLELAWSVGPVPASGTTSSPASGTTSSPASGTTSSPASGTTSSQSPQPPTA